MHSIVFTSLDAILSERHENSFRSFFALRRFGSTSEAQSRSEALVGASVAQQLSLIVSENRPCFVVTSLYLPGVDRLEMQDHMKLMDLATVGENLAEPWSTDVRRSSTRVDEISAWLANHGRADDPYAIIDVEKFGAEINGTRHENHAVLIDSDLRKLSDLASAVGSVLSPTGGGNPRA